MERARMFQEIWQRVTATRYTRVLEAEVARLRAENRALMNSILGIAGVPPITLEVTSVQGFWPPATGAASAAETDDKNKRDPSSLRSLGMTTKGNGAGDAPAQYKATAGRVQAASPMRRRSWQQINRGLEFESARKKERPGSAAPAGASEPNGAVMARRSQ